MTPDKKIVDFIAYHHVLTLATTDSNGMAYCAACFYAYNKACNRLIFTSDESTNHAQHMIANSNVACGITRETKVVGKVQGVQICGIAKRGDQADKLFYLRRFPYAAVTQLNIWVVEPTFIKLTDNTLGFGKKLIWRSIE